jgi:hypothetical protein
MSIWTAMWRTALLITGLIAAPVGLDLEQGFWVHASGAYARGPSGGAAGGGLGDGRGGWWSERCRTWCCHPDRGGAAESAANAAGPDARGGGGGRNRESREFSDRGDFGAVGHAPDREQDGAAAHLTAKASAGPGQEFDTDTAVFVFGEQATEALIRAGCAAPQVRPDRAVIDLRQKVRTYVAIATALGHPAYVGVMQATFGSDWPGRGPAGDWQDVNLDLNGDGILDEHDLELARQRQVTR